MKLLFSTLLAIASLTANQDDYFDLLKTAPALIEPIGNAAQGEIEILLDPEKIAAIEQKTGRKIGIVGRDTYWTWVNDAVRFPSGSEGVYSRIFFTKSNGDPRPGVAVLALLPDGKIVLNCNYRHATRSWEIEIPRGGKFEGETAADAARREAFEETGMTIDSLTFLGEMATDTGVIAGIVPIYKAKVVKKESSSPEDSEAIEEILALSVDEIKEAFRKGYWEMEIRGRTQKVPFRDSFLAYALLQHLIEN